MCRYYVLPKKVEQAFEDGSLFNPRSAPVARGIEDDAALAAEDEDVEDTMVRLLRLGHKLISIISANVVAHASLRLLRMSTFLTPWCAAFNSSDMRASSSV